MRLLDLFCGAGGAAMGYRRAGFDDIIGVDIREQPNYPFDFVQMDALEFLRVWFDKRGGQARRPVDAIHASPPCQGYTSLVAFNKAKNGSVPDHPKLIEPVRDLLRSTTLPYIIENVPQAPLRPESITLCGSMFGLRVRRHRRFETNFPLLRHQCRHYGQDFVGVYGDHPESASLGGGDGYTRKPRASTIAEAQEAMGTPWMPKWNEIKEAIPPAYTEYIGIQLRTQLERVA